MSQPPVNQARRRFLTATTAVIGGLGMAATSVPFIKSWNPSQQVAASGAPIEINLGKLQIGQMVRVIWRGKPIWIVRRSPEQLAELATVETQLRDPTSLQSTQPIYAQNRYRSIHPEFFIAVGLCTHLGCTPSYRPQHFNEQVQGVEAGFFCPCHGSTFDMAGRVFKDVPAPLNLEIPRHYFIDDHRLVIGTDQLGRV